MKRILLVFVIVAVSGFSVNCFGQKTYVKANLGYGFPTLKSNDFNTFKSVKVYNSLLTEEITYRLNDFSFGEGSVIGLDLGRELNEMVAIELGFNYLKSNTLEDNSEVQYFSEFTGKNIGNEYYNYDFKGQMMYSNVGIAFNLYLKGNTSLNFRYGALIAFCSFKEYADHKVWYDLGFDDVNAELKHTLVYAPNLSLGYYANAGAEHQLSRNLACFVDLQLNVVDYKPKEAEFKEYEVLQDADIFFSKSPDKIEFVDEYTVKKDSNNYGNQRLRNSYSFSSFGAKGGLKFYF